MKHLFKVPLQNSDMFVSSITDEHITYTVRDAKEVERCVYVGDNYDRPDEALERGLIYTLKELEDE